MKYNASDEKQIEKRKKREKSDRDQYIDDLRTLIALPAGLRFFKKMMDEGKMFQTTFTGNSQTFFLEGHRAFAVKYFVDLVEASPNKIGDLILREGEKDNDITSK